MENITQTLTLDLVDIRHNVINAKQGDRLVRDLDITITNNGARYPVPEGATVRLRGHRPDNQYTFYDGTVKDSQNGIVHIDIPDFLLSCSGRAKLDIGIYENTTADKTKIASTETFVLYIPPNVFSEDEVINSDQGSVLSKLIHTAQKEIDEMNTLEAEVSKKDNLRTLEEEKRQINEQTRKTNESARISAESARQTNEQTRQANETVRVSAETERSSAESERQTNEQTRQANEFMRTSKESERQTSEQTRRSEEASRISAEAERSSAESERMEKEQERTAAENLRITNETNRQNDELARQASEQERQTAYEAMSESIDCIKNAIGKKNGIAQLGEDGIVVPSQLPPHINDIVEGYYSNNQFYTEPSCETEIAGEAGKLYVDIGESNNIYRWSESSFVPACDIIALGETSSTAYRGDHGKTAYEHSQTGHAPANAEINQNAFSNVSVGSATIAAQIKTDTITLTAGSNVTLTPDTTNHNITISSANTNWPSAKNINGMLVQGTADRTNYGACSTAAATAAKSVPCSGFALINGAEITVKFTVTNTAANPTLNVNSTGAKPIYYRGSAIPAGQLAANRTYNFRYNGSQYELVGDLDTNTVNLTGVKGNAESSYRTGNVNLTPANLGLGNVNNTADANKSVKYASSAGNADTLDNLHASNFIKVADNSTSVETIQTIGLDPSFHDVQNAEIGIPSGKYFSILNLGTYAGTGGADRTQIAFPYQESLTDTDMYIRTAKGKTWRSWRKVWHTGNLSFSNANISRKTGRDGGCYCIPADPANKSCYHLHLCILDASCTTTSAWITIATCSSKPSQIAEGTVRISDGGLLVSGLERCNARIDTAGNIQITTPTAFSNKNIVVDIFWR